MEYLNNLKGQEVLPMNQLGEKAVKTVQLSASRGEHQSGGPKPSRQPTKMIVTVPTFDQQLQFEDEVENNISDPEAEDGLFSEPIHCDGRLSFLVEAFQQLYPIWRLRVLSATCLVIMAALVSIRFYPDNLREAKRIHWSADDLHEAKRIHWSADDLHMAESIHWSADDLDDPLNLTLEFSYPTRQLQAGHQFVFYSRPEMDRPEPSTGMLEYIVHFILGPNQSEPIWRLRLLAALNLVVHAMLGILFLPRYLHRIQATYQRVMLIMSVGVPIVVAVITLLVSVWLAPDPYGQSNWITGLSVANASILGGHLAVYWAHKWGT